MDAQQVVRVTEVRKLHPVLQTHFGIHLTGQKHLHIFVMLQKIVPAVLRDLQGQGGFPDLLTVVFDGDAAVDAAVARIQDDDHIFFTFRRHRQGQGHHQNQGENA